MRFAGVLPLSQLLDELFVPSGRIYLEEEMDALWVSAPSSLLSLAFKVTSQRPLYRQPILRGSYNDRLSLRDFGL